MKKILFVCVENSCRSQMTEGLARHVGKLLLEPYSAGSKPSRVVNPNAIKVMKEIGIDISRYRSKGFDDLAERDFDYVITLGCGDACPFFPAGKHVDWNIEDPKNKDIEYFRKTRDQIKAKIQQLLTEIKDGKTF